MGATREESHALATVLREDDVVDHKPIRRGGGQPRMHAASLSHDDHLRSPLAPFKRFPNVRQGPE